MKVLITGSEGQLGSTLKFFKTKKYSNHKC